MKNNLLIALLLNIIFCSVETSVATSTATSSTSTPRIKAESSLATPRTTATIFDKADQVELAAFINNNHDSRDLLFGLATQPDFPTHLLRLNRQNRREERTAAPILRNEHFFTPPPPLHFVPRNNINIADQPLLNHSFRTQDTTQAVRRPHRHNQNSPISNSNSPIAQNVRNISPTQVSAQRTITPSQQPGSPSYAEMVRRLATERNNK